jgi:hypothetical protein
MGLFDHRRKMALDERFTITQGSEIVLYYIVFVLYCIVFIYLFRILGFPTVSVVEWSEFRATDPEVPGSIPNATRFS